MENPRKNDVGSWPDTKVGYQRLVEESRYDDWTKDEQTKDVVSENTRYEDAVEGPTEEVGASRYDDSTEDERTKDVNGQNIGKEDTTFMAQGYTRGAGHGRLY